MTHTYPPTVTGDVTAAILGRPPETVPASQTVVTDDYYSLTYLLPPEYVADVLADEDAKWATLAGMGIARPADVEVSPLATWRDAVADASGIDRAALDPARGGRLDLAFSPASVRRFVFYLA